MIDIDFEMRADSTDYLSEGKLRKVKVECESNQFWCELGLDDRRLAELVLAVLAVKTHFASYVKYP